MVSELCLGCMTFGREADQEASKGLVSRFLEAGGNFVDTADVYANGVSEEITGRALKGVRDEVVLATKVRFPMGDGPNDVGLSRKHVIKGGRLQRQGAHQGGHRGGRQGGLRGLAPGARGPAGDGGRGAPNPKRLSTERFGFFT